MWMANHTTLAYSSSMSKIVLAMFGGIRADHMISPRAGFISANGDGSGCQSPAATPGTSAAISHVGITADATVSGRIAATGQGQGVDPAQIKPGAAALAYIFFASQKIPAHPSYHFTFDASAADQSFFNTANLKVTQANRSGESIAGELVNDNKVNVTGGAEVDVFCFTGSRLTAESDGATNSQADTPPGGTDTFTVPLFDPKCGSYLVGAFSYFGS